MNEVKNRCTSPTNVSAFYAFPDIALVDSQNNEADIRIEYPSVICLSMTTLPRPPCRPSAPEETNRVRERQPVCAPLTSMPSAL